MDMNTVMYPEITGSKEKGSKADQKMKMDENNMIIQSMIWAVPTLSH